MFATSQDLLNLTLAVGFGVLTIFLAIVLFYLAVVLRDLSQTTQAVKHAAQQIDDLIIAPTRLISFLFEKIRTLLASFDFEQFLPDSKKPPVKTAPPARRGKKGGG